MTVAHAASPPKVVWRSVEPEAQQAQTARTFGLSASRTRLHASAPDGRRQYQASGQADANLEWW
jgi:hypothetical protein